MKTEIEAKFLNIDPDLMRARLKEAGASLVHPERLMRRRNFDYPDRRLEKSGEWIRVRDEGDQVTLAYKKLVDRTLDGTKEISLVVEHFEKVSIFLSALGLEEKSYQETKRERWDWKGVEITIDTWPWIPTFLELEGESEEVLKETAKAIGLNWENALHGSVEIAYQAAYKVTEQEVDSWKEITFTSVPEWLEPLRK